MKTTGFNWPEKACQVITRTKATAKKRKNDLKMAKRDSIKTTTISKMTTQRPKRETQNDQKMTTKRLNRDKTRETQNDYINTQKMTSKRLKNNS